MSITVGAVDIPTAWNPALEAISIFERLWFKPDPVIAANCGYFCLLVSLDAAIRPKFRTSPVAAAPLVIVMLNCLLELFGQSCAELALNPEQITAVLEPVTSHVGTVVGHDDQLVHRSGIIGGVNHRAVAMAGHIRRHCGGGSVKFIGIVQTHGRTGSGVVSVHLQKAGAGAV